MKKRYKEIEINFIFLEKDVIMKSDKNALFDNVVEDPFI